MSQCYSSSLLNCAFILMLAGCQSGSAPANPRVAVSTSPEPVFPSATVISVGDGDTLRLQMDNAAEPITVRLACIDAPERNQPGGDWSAVELSTLLPRGTSVQYDPLDTDQYNRTVAELWQDGQSINLELVRTGAAVVYPPYVGQCFDPAAFETAQSNAASQKVGFWSLPLEQRIFPWDWRQKGERR